MFVDRVKIEVLAGRGGNGCSSFRREAFVPKGGPDGGNGGHGGSIVIIACEDIDNLAALAHRKIWKAKRGLHGSGANRVGRSSDDLIIQVPPGTLVIDAEQDFVIKDLAKLGDQVTAARGGKGGWGNTHFKSSTNRTPRKLRRVLPVGSLGINFVPSSLTGRRRRLLASISRLYLAFCFRLFFGFFFRFFRFFHSLIFVGFTAAL